MGKSMSIFIYVFTIVAAVVFLAAVLSRVVSYKKNPMHLRWELYPVAHEGKAHGGGYLEEVDWWKSKPKSSKVAELSVMLPEMILLKALWEHNRGMWIVSFPFHFGLYLCVGFGGLTLVCALAQLIGLPTDSGILALLIAVTSALGPFAFGLSLFGALGLLLRRLGDSELRRYSALSHSFNLLLFIATLAVALAVWVTDPIFVLARTFVANLISFNFAAIDSYLFMIHVLMVAFMVAYIPLTHMSHFFMKYFLYHDIRWEDKPNIEAPEINASLGEVLNYPISWSASHIAIPGKTTWAEVATFNPAAPEPKKEGE